jgi:thioredoxin reductase (NADPH)
LKPTLTVLSRTYCHLCDDLIAQLKLFQARYDFEIDVVDIDRNPKLEEKWGDKVPVLLHGEAEICRYFLDAAALQARLQPQSAPPPE